MAIHSYDKARSAVLDIIAYPPVERREILPNPNTRTRYGQARGLVRRRPSQAAGVVLRTRVPGCKLSCRPSVTELTVNVGGLTAPPPDRRRCKRTCSVIHFGAILNGKWGTWPRRGQAGGSSDPPASVPPFSESGPPHARQGRVLPLVVHQLEDVEAALRVGRIGALLAEVVGRAL